MKNKLFTHPVSVSMIAVFCTLLWGSAYPAVKVGYEWFAVAPEDIWGKLLFAGIRFFGAGVLTFIMAVITHKHLMIPRGSYLPAIGALGFVQTFLQYVCFYIALANMTGAKGAVINAMGTFLSVIIAHFLFKDDRMNRQKVIGCLLGITGIIIVNLKGGIGGGFSLMGDGVMCMAALAFAMGNILSKKLGKDLDALWLTGYQLLFGGGLLMIVGLLGGGRLTVITAKGIWLMFYMAFLSAAAFTLWLMLLKNNPVGKIAMFSALIPVFGTLLSGIVLGENVLTAANILALICVTAGIYVINQNKNIE